MAQTIQGESSLGLTIGGKLVQGKLTAYTDGTAKWTYQKDINPLVAGGGDRSTFTLTKRPDGTWSWNPTTNTSVENLATRENLTNAQITDSLYKTPQLQTTLYGQTVNLLGGIPAAKQIDPNYPTTQGVATTPTIPIQQQVSGNPNKPDPADTTVDPNVSQINPEKGNPAFQDLVYPTGIRSNGQDFIKFTVIKYITRKLNTSANNSFSGAIGVLENRRDTSNANLTSGQEKEVKGSIILPIQPSISDSNNVDWNGLGINPLEMELLNGSLNIMSGSGQQYVNDLIGRLQTTIKDPNVINAIKLQFAQKAAGVEGMLSRVAGAVVNPNLELLFQGPTLRPFNFTFRLSPRNSKEATTVRKIIRVFKQYSAVGTASGGLFLTTPNVFNISYHNRGNEKSNHPSLNRIKTCALKSVSVDYTPDGSYMTFNDNYNTMTSYSISLQFQELEPVTTSDYIDKIPDDEIGY
jgi:hypothetical protein